VIKTLRISPDGKFKAAKTQPSIGKDEEMKEVTTGNTEKFISAQVERARPTQNECNAINNLKSASTSA
jgi:hypothetical protein